MSNDNGFGKVVFWLAYVIFAGVATFHTFEVMQTSNPPLIALGAALGVDAFLAYALYMVGKVSNQNRIVGFLGVAAFVAISALAQIIQRFQALGVEMPEWMVWVSFFLLPVSVTAAVTILGVIHYFESEQTGRRSQGKPQFQRPPMQEGMSDNGRQDQPRGEPAHLPQRPQMRR